MNGGLRGKLSAPILTSLARVHGPRGTLVQQRTRCGSMRDDPADIRPEATSKDASVSSDRRTQRDCCPLMIRLLLRQRGRVLRTTPAPKSAGYMASPCPPPR